MLDHKPSGNEAGFIGADNLVVTRGVKTLREVDKRVKTDIDRSVKVDWRIKQKERSIVW